MTVAAVPAAGLVSMLMWVGILMYVVFEGCDPVESGRIDSPAQVRNLYETYMETRGQWTLTFCYTTAVGIYRSNVHNAPMKNSLIEYLMRQKSIPRQ